MNEMIEQARYYLDALWRRRWLVLGTACMVAALGWAAVAGLPNQYRSSARIYVDTANVLGPLLSGVAVQNDLGRQVDVMRRTLLSRPNLEQVARMTDLDLDATTPSQMDVLTGRLQEDIDLQSGRENLFDISYSSTSPVLARNVVQAVTTIFVENNLGQNRSDIDNAQVFLREQIATYERSLNESEAALAKFKQENMAFLPGQTGLQAQLADAETHLATIEGQLDDTTKRVELLTGELAQTSEMLGETAFGSGPPTETEAEIIRLQGVLADLESRYTAQHPDVVTMRRRLENLRADFEAQIDSFGSKPGPVVGGSNLPNPVYAQLRMELIRERGNAEVLREQVGRARDSVNTLSRRIQLVPEIEAQMKRLTRDYEIIRSNYDTLRARQESARISADRDEQGNSVNFRIIEVAKVPTLPSGPPRAAFLTVVLLASLVAGGAVSWLLAVTRVTYGSLQHLRRDFAGIPVIGGLTRVDQNVDRRRIKWRTAGFLASILVLLVAFLALLLLESRFGLQAVLVPALMISGAVFLFGVFSVLKWHFGWPGVSHGHDMTTMPGAVHAS